MTELGASYVIDSDSVKINAIDFIAELPADGSWQVVIEPYLEECSSAQIKLFWVWCRYVAKAMRERGQPCSESRVHDVVCIEIFGVEQSALDPSVIRPSRTISKPRKATKALMSEVLNRFIVWAAEIDIQLPDPRGSECESGL